MGTRNYPGDRCPPLAGLGAQVLCTPGAAAAAPASCPQVGLLPLPPLSPSPRRFVATAIGLLAPCAPAAAPTPTHPTHPSTPPHLMSLARSYAPLIKREGVDRPFWHDVRDGKFKPVQVGRAGLIPSRTMVHGSPGIA